MASDSSRSYIHPASLQNMAACKVYHTITGDELQNEFDLDHIMGFQIMIIEGSDQETDEFIPTHELSQNKYPYVFIRVQPNEEDKLHVDQWMLAREAVRIQ